jgi:hypothetical protein
VLESINETRVEIDKIVDKITNRQTALQNDDGTSGKKAELRDRFEQFKELCWRRKTKHQGELKPAISQRHREPRRATHHSCSTSTSRAGGCDGYGTELGRPSLSMKTNSTPSVMSPLETTTVMVGWTSWLAYPAVTTWCLVSETSLVAWIGC